MRYCIVNSRSHRVTYYQSKRELHDWIRSHANSLSARVLLRLRLHHVVVVPYHDSTSLYVFHVGSFISTLLNYVLKYKLI